MNNVRTEPPPTYNTQPYTPPSRPALRYHGSKWQLAGWIISYLPPHDLYCEPFCGASAVLLNKPRSPLECINDLDGEVVNYFQVLRDYPDELIRVIELTPFAKKEWALSNQPTPDPVEAARRFYVRAYMNIAGPTSTWRSGWRRQKTYTRNANGRAGMGAAALTFAKIDHLYDIADRLRGVTIENDDAFKIFERYDSPHACFYVDPPYPTSTRSSGAANTYAHEMTDDEHGRLSNTLHNLAGHVLISGYQCDLYDDLYHDWPRVDRKARTNNPKQTAVESIWISPSAWDAIDRPTQLDLFEKETQP